MSIIAILIILVIIGVIMYVVNHAVPLDPPWPLIINAIVIIAVLLWLLQNFGVIGPTIRIR